MSPGRWHDVQFAKKIGATSLLNVGAAAFCCANACGATYKALNTTSAGATRFLISSPGSKVRSLIFGSRNYRIAVPVERARCLALTDGVRSGVRCNDSSKAALASAFRPEPNIISPLTLGAGLIGSGGPE